MSSEWDRLTANHAAALQRLCHGAAVTSSFDIVGLPWTPRGTTTSTSTATGSLWGSGRGRAVDGPRGALHQLRRLGRGRRRTLLIRCRLPTCIREPVAFGVLSQQAGSNGVVERLQDSGVIEVAHLLSNCLGRPRSTTAHPSQDLSEGLQLARICRHDGATPEGSCSTVRRLPRFASLSRLQRHHESTVSPRAENVAFIVHGTRMSYSSKRVEIEDQAIACPPIPATDAL